MCGRYTLSAPPKTLTEWFELAVPAPADLAPRWNVAPSQPVAIVPNRGPRAVALARWGLVPYWATDPSVGARQINARAETLRTRPAFRDAYRLRRCLVLADGFYEWRGRGAGRTPMLIRRRDGAPFAFAGVWDTWRGGPDPLRTCAIVTTAPNALVAPIHDRMPVVLPRAAWAAWLAPGEAPVDLDPLLRPFPPDDWSATEVSRLVNDPRHDEPGCVAPVAPLPLFR